MKRVLNALSLCCLTVLFSTVALADVLFQEDFESGFPSGWSVDSSVWEVGPPTSGPGGCYSGSQCAATVLDDDYPNSARSRLISAPFVVPAASQIPRLRFWHWFLFYTQDYSDVQISVDYGAWEALTVYNYTPSGGGVWTYELIDLASYAGQSVRIGFRMWDNTAGGTSSGWYIDDISVETGPYQDLSSSLESFESGIGDWGAERGTWEVGSPTSGPGGCYSGSQCAATVLDDDYPNSARSRLISAPFVVPAASQIPRLRFWHWFLFYTQDYSDVQISVDYGAWEALTVYNYTPSGGGVWTYELIDLASYAGQSVRIGFRMWDNTAGGTSSGWYIDDISVETGPYQDLSSSLENFESGIGDWGAERGTWEVGSPTSGPGGCYSGSQCAATVLDDDYPNSARSRLISAPFVVPAASQNPRLRFWHWFLFYTQDYSDVQISVDYGAWEALTVYNYTPSGGGVWTYELIDLASYAGQSVRIGFRMWDNTLGGTSSGWYIDDISVETGPYQDLSSSLESFESGIGDWGAERGTWEVGSPTSGPGGCYSGSQCAATVLDDDYPNSARSRLISAPFVVPAASQNPQLTFRHWFLFYTQDYSDVQISVDYGDWEALTVYNYTSSSGDWLVETIDLASYAGKSVRIGFRMWDNILGGTQSGWYIDDVQIVKDAGGGCLAATALEIE